MEPKSAPTSPQTRPGLMRTNEQREVHDGGRTWPLGTILSAAIAISLLALAGCAATLPGSATPTGIEGPSNRESPEEAAEVQTVVSEAKPQPFPQQLEGCWEGSVSQSDSFKWLARTSEAMFTPDCCTPVNYVLCFDRASGGVSFSASSISVRMVSQWGSAEVVPVDSHTDLLFSSGDDFAVLRSIGHYEMNSTVIGIPLGAATISSTTDLCATAVGPDKIYVEGAEEDVWGSQPWDDSTWHGEFTRELRKEASAGGHK